MKQFISVAAVLLMAASALVWAQTQPSQEQSATPGWLGCKLAEIDSEIAEHLGLDSSDGVLIVEVLDGSPAKGAGLLDNDVVRKMDNRPIHDLDELRDVMRKSRPGQVMKFSVIRAEKPVEIDVKLGDRPAIVPPKPPELPN
jgi:serine protease Do